MSPWSASQQSDCSCCIRGVVLTILSRVASVGVLAVAAGLSLPG